MKEFCQKLLGALLAPVLLGLVGFCFLPWLFFGGFILGLVANLIIWVTYPKSKMTIYAVQNGYDGKYWQAYADFLWYKNVKILGWMEDNGHRFIFSKSDLENYVKFLIKEESLPAVPIHKDIIYKPEAKVSKSSIQDDIEHIKQVAQESGINMESFNKIEEILNKTYEDEPPAKPMVSPPVVLSVDGAVVTYKKDGKTQSRSRRGFAKQYGEPVLSKPSPERAKKAGQKAKAR